MKKIFIHPLFIVYAIMLAILGHALSLLVYFFAVIIHEYAHYFVAKKLGYKLKKLLIMPYGACLNYETMCFSSDDEFKIAIAGPFVNFLLFIIIVASWWIFPQVYSLTYVFCMSNLVLFLFNLLPCFPLDGGRVLISILNKKMNRKQSIKIAIFFNIIIIIIFVLTFIIGLFFKVYNFNLIIISIFLLAGIIQPQKEFGYKYLTIKNNKKNLYLKGIGVNLICVDYSLELYKICAKLNKNKFNIIYAIYENNNVKCFNEIILNRLLLKYSPTTKLNEIIEMFI